MLIDRGMLAPREATDGLPPYEVTERGRDAAEKLIGERHATIARWLDGWDAEQHADLIKLLSRLADEVGHEPSEELVTH